MADIAVKIIFTLIFAFALIFPGIEFDSKKRKKQ